MYQPYSSSGQLTEPPRPPAPAPVLTAVKLMYAGAAISIVTMITELALIPAIKAALRTANPSLTAAQVRPVNVLLTLEIVLGLVRGRPVAVDGAGQRPRQELGAHPVHGAVRPGDAGGYQRHQADL